jgi:polysaccharide deacetylase family protein (PEP-CTERM system associated)
MSSAVITKHGPPVISVDVEDWFQSTWDVSLPIGERAVANTEHVLELLAAHHVSATMFVVGLFAEKFPATVRRLHAQGHEIACHTYGHVQAFRKSRQEFTEKTRKCKDLLEQIVGERVRGYRAADFSITERSLWALEVLADLGFDYDSSIFPVKAARYGIAGWPRHPVMVQLPNAGRILEFPIATYRVLGRNWPVGGGGYHRLLPGWVTRAIARRVLDETNFVFYCHPYEFAPDEFANADVPIPWTTRLHQGLGRARFEQRFLAFIKTFGGQRFVDILGNSRWPVFRVPEYQPRADALGTARN